jgi:Flp pilus assembly protein TadD
MDELTEEKARRILTEGEGYMELELWDQARERLQTVVESGLLPLECSILAGNIHVRRNEYSEAVPLFQHALELQPGNRAATFGLGWCLKRIGRPGDAARAYEAALEAHGDDALLHYNLACYRSLAGEAPGALDALASALRLKSEYRDLAREDADFDAIRAMPEFQALVG